MAETIPVIDLKDFGVSNTSKSPPVEALKSIGSNLVEAFADIGFAYVINHGVPGDVIEAIFSESKSFFNLPLETKNLALKQKGFTGYAPVNAEKFASTAGEFEMRESFDLDTTDSNFLEDHVPLFGPSIRNYLQNLLPLVDRLLTALEFGLGYPPNTLMERHANILKGTNMSALRLLHYPPVVGEVPEGAIRCGTHTDYGTVTLLIQDQMGGLEVKNRHGKWVKAIPVPGAILLNVGDSMQRFTNDRIKATEHRVLIPKEERISRCSRFSMAFFADPDNEVKLHPLEGGETQYDSVTAKDYIDGKFAAAFNY